MIIVETSNRIFKTKKLYEEGPDHDNETRRKKEKLKQNLEIIYAVDAPLVPI
jgi:hypothetical protein